MTVQPDQRQRMKMFQFLQKWLRFLLLITLFKLNLYLKLLLTQMMLALQYQDLVFDEMRRLHGLDLNT